MDEQRLTAAAARGDIVSFNRLVQSHQQTAYEVAFHLLGDAQSAAQITETAVMRAYRRLGVEKGARFRILLLRFVLELCRKEIALAKTFVVSDDSNNIIRTGLRRLPFEERAAVVLADIEGLTHQEIGAIMRLNPNLVRSSLARGRAQLREFLVANFRAGRSLITPTGAGRTNPDNIEA